jgi:hypothetical protein
MISECAYSGVQKIETANIPSNLALPPLKGSVLWLCQDSDKNARKNQPLRQYGMCDGAFPQCLCGRKIVLW